MSYVEVLTTADLKLVLTVPVISDEFIRFSVVCHRDGHRSFSSLAHVNCVFLAYWTMNGLHYFLNLF